jgi:hypothetical protein
MRGFCSIFKGNDSLESLALFCAIKILILSYAADFPLPNLQILI